MCLVHVFIFVKKSWAKYEITLFKSGERIFSFVAHLLPSLSFLFPESRKPNPRSPHLHRRLRTSTVGLHAPRISSPLSVFQDPVTNRAFVTADPSLQDLGSNLTFTLLVNGFLSIEWTIPSSLTDFTLFCFCFFVFVFCFCFLFFVFLFFLTNRENPFFLFIVCCWDNIWFKIQTYKPYILEI